MISIQPGSSLAQRLFFFLMRQPKAFLIMSVLCMSKQYLDNQFSQHNIVALPNPFSCFLMNTIYLNQLNCKIQCYNCNL